MIKYKMTLAYDGTQYAGWQVQDNAVAIQAVVQHALTTVLRRQTFVIGSGRTDAGVHALGQVAHFETVERLDLFRFVYACNALLPPDIRILDIEEAVESFHARYGAVSKTYHYHLHLHPISNPFTSKYRYHLRGKICLQAMRDAAFYFLGTHDFTSFSNASHRGSCAKDPVRTLFRLDICEEEGGVRLEFEGDGFLYKMVRNIVGTLIDIGAGKIQGFEIPSLFAVKRRSALSSAAPPWGLFLYAVRYTPL